MNKGRGMKIDPIVAVLLLGIVALAAGWIQLPVAAVGGVADQTGVDCAGGNQPIAYATAMFTDPTQNNKQSQVATTITFAKTGTPTIYNSTTSSTTIQTTTSVPCGQALAVIAGDGGSTYYFNAKDAGLVTRTSIDATGIEVVKSGAATIVFENSSGSGWASTITESGGEIADPDADLQYWAKVPTTAGAYFGDKGWAMCFRYDSANFTQIRPTNYAAQVSIPHIKASTTLNSVSCWEMNGLLKSGGSDLKGNIYMDRAAALTGGNSSISVVLVDKTSMLFNGALFVGYDTGITDGLNTDAGRADVTVTNAVIIGT